MVRPPIEYSVAPDQRARQIPIVSSVRMPRRRKGTLRAANSGASHPDATPAMTRPSLKLSRLASAFASTTGLRYGATSTLVPRPMRSVAAAAQVRTVSASWKWAGGRVLPGASAM